MILGLQITAIIFSLLMIYFSVLHYKRKEIGPTENIIWIAIWVTTILITIFPEFLRTHALSFAVSRLFDLMVVCGFLLTIYLVASVYVRTRRLEKKLEKFVRQDAVNKVTIKKKK